MPLVKAPFQTPFLDEGVQQVVWRVLRVHSWKCSVPSPPLLPTTHAHLSSALSKRSQKQSLQPTRNTDREIDTQQQLLSNSVFLCYFPSIQGVVIGYFIGVFIGLWISIGSLIYPPVVTPLPLSTHGCYNITDISHYMTTDMYDVTPPVQDTEESTR